MIDYYEAHQIESTRKEHRCFECQKTILAASRCHILTAFRLRGASSPNFPGLPAAVAANG